MKVFFQIALLSAFAFASSQSDEVVSDSEFMAFAASHSRNIKDIDEMQRRKQEYGKAKKRIAELNRQSKGVTFKLNQFADILPEEKEKLRNRYDPDEDESENVKGIKPDQRTSSSERGGRKLLSSVNRSLNWVDRGVTTPVKNQGSCAACTLFTGTTVLEAMYSIKHGTTPVRLSEQEGTDCVPNITPCVSGHVPKYWNWTVEHGANTYDNYPYEESSGNGCRHQDEKDMTYSAAWGSVKEWRHQWESPTIREDILAELENGPVAVYVYASNDCWYYYDSGVLTSDIPCQGGNGHIDHAVTIVGFHHGLAPGSESSIESGEQQEFNRTCRWALDEERSAGQCSGANETFAPNRYGEEARKCCWYEPIPAREEEGGEYDMDNSYWIIQNSYSEYWGENGFIKLKAETGDGVSQMNRHVYFMTDVN